MLFRSEAIGAAITVSFGFTNAMWAILVVSAVIFLSGLPISYYSAKYGVDIDLLTRGAGFGYLGSTLTSLIYASFTFIFFALEGSIMARAIEMAVGLPIAWAYVVSSLVIIPLVMHGVTLIGKIQTWTQPVWLVLMVLPFAAVLYQDPDAPLDHSPGAHRVLAAGGCFTSGDLGENASARPKISP